MITKKYRNEWKYYCTKGEAFAICSRLSSALPTDPYSGSNGKYEVHSLYFDDYKNRAMKEVDAGISERSKYRIRYYGNQFNQMKLERKEKLDGLCHKESCLITPEEYQKIMEHDEMEIFWTTEKPLLKQFCASVLMGYLQPKVIISYERTAFIEPVTNLRITFDENISASAEVDCFAGNYMRFPIFPEDRRVLEVKFDTVLQGYVRHLTEEKHLTQASVSKYSLGRRLLQEMEQYQI